MRRLVVHKRKYVCRAQSLNPRFANLANRNLSNKQTRYPQQGRISRREELKSHIRAGTKPSILSRNQTNEISNKKRLKVTPKLTYPLFTNSHKERTITVGFNCKNYVIIADRHRRIMLSRFSTTIGRWDLF